jgi:hypothetical protein
MLVGNAVADLVMEPPTERAGTLQISNAPATQGLHLVVMDIVPFATE